MTTVLLIKVTFILSVSLQLAGAILLIIKYWEKPMVEQLHDLYSRQNHVTEKRFQIGNAAPNNTEYLYEATLSRIAFIYIAAGYLLGIFGEKGQPFLDFLMVIIIVLLIIPVSIKIAHICSSK